MVSCICSNSISTSGKEEKKNKQINYMQILHLLFFHSSNLSTYIFTYLSRKQKLGIYSKISFYRFNVTILCYAVFPLEFACMYTWNSKLFLVDTLNASLRAFCSVTSLYNSSFKIYFTTKYLIWFQQWHALHITGDRYLKQNNSICCFVAIVTVYSRLYV